MRKLFYALAPAAGLLACLAVTAPASAQQVEVPRPSPNASVSQMIGLTEVTLHYSRPGVKGRKIWGDLVPFKQVWRAGANENTTITFSTPVTIGGKELAAGTYGLQTIPDADSWTIIFSKDAKLWGAYDYKAENDALRVDVKPQPADAFQERMSFDFTDLSDSSATLELRWEKLNVPLKITADTNKQLKASVRWQSPYSAANYCIQANTCLDDAGRWLDASIALDDNFFNERAKALLLAKQNDFKGAATHGDKALALGAKQKQAPPPEQVKDLETQVAGWKKK